MPDFAEAIAIAVGWDGDGHRRCISLWLCDGVPDLAARDGFVAAALAAGALEWHIHLLAADARERRAAAQDLEDCLAAVSAA